MSYVLAGKKVVFISPKRDAFPHFVNEFKRVYFQHTGKNPDGIIHARMNTDESLFPSNAQIYICAPYDIVKGAEVTVHGALAEAGLVVVDEVHRIPHDPENDTKIIGKVEPIVRQYAMSKGAKVICMTGTYGRADGKAPFGKHTPDYKVTAQQLIDEGSLPSLFGYSIPIELEINDNEIRRTSDTIQLRLARRKLTKYLSKVADPMMEIIALEEIARISRGAMKSTGHAIFVSRKIEAIEICDILNGKLSWKAFVPYLAETTAEEREEIQESCEKVNCWVMQQSCLVLSH
jgi:superfamily II DNA or RNA helicase